MTDLADRLNAFILESGSRPVVWGESDCTAWPRRWVETVRGRRIALPPWSSREEAHALIAKAGSLEALWSPALSRFGLVENFMAPECGDVGIIETRIAGQVGVIFLHETLAAWRAEPAGVRALRPRHIVKVWSIR